MVENTADNSLKSELGKPTIFSSKRMKAWLNFYDVYVYKQ